MSSSEPVSFGSPADFSGKSLARGTSRHTGSHPGNLSQLLVAGEYLPTTVLVDQQWLYISHLGAAERYFDLDAASVGSNIVMLARSEVGPCLCAALHDARAHSSGVSASRIQRSSYDARLEIRVEQIIDCEEKLFLVFLIERRNDLPDADVGSSSEARPGFHNGQNAIAGTSFSGGTIEIHPEETRDRADLQFLQDVLRSAATPMLVLDLDLCIRAFTSTAATIFRTIPGDVGRPLADLRPMQPNDTLIDEARDVLRTGRSSQSDVVTDGGVGYRRHLAPCYEASGAVEGLIITLVESANPNRSLVPASVDPDERQADVLQYVEQACKQQREALVLLQEAVRTRDTATQACLTSALERFENVTQTLQRLVEITQGRVQRMPRLFPLHEITNRLRAKLAAAENVELRVVGGHRSVYSDPDLLEEMLRHLLAIATKFFGARKVIAGCRVQDGEQKLEIFWLSSDSRSRHSFRLLEELNAENPLGSLSGFGIDHLLVQQLRVALGNRLRFRWDAHNRVVASLDLRSGADSAIAVRAPAGSLVGGDAANQPATVLIVEWEKECREALRYHLERYGYSVIAAATDAEAFALMADKMQKPIMVFVASHLTSSVTGLDFVRRIRRLLQSDVPSILIDSTGDTSCMDGYHVSHCSYLRSPLNDGALLDAIRSACDGIVTGRPTNGQIVVVSDDEPTRAEIRRALLQHGQSVEDYATFGPLFEEEVRARAQCVLIDLDLPGMNDAQLVRILSEACRDIPVLVMTSKRNLGLATDAIDMGAYDFIEKPIDNDVVIANVMHVTAKPDFRRKPVLSGDQPLHLSQLTARQRLVLQLVLEGHPSKLIAAKLGISQRTVENHRAGIMKRLGAKSLPRLARIAFAAGWKTDSQ